MEKNELSNEVKAIDSRIKNCSLKTLKNVGKLSLHLLSIAFIIGSASSPAKAIDSAEAAKQVVASESGKKP